MAEFKDLIEGIQILEKYCKPEDQSLAAEHDILYVGRAFDEEEYKDEEGRGTVTDEEWKKLDKLGFHFDSEFHCWAKFV